MKKIFCNKWFAYIYTLALVSCGGGSQDMGVTPHIHYNPITQLDVSKLGQLSATGYGGTLSPSDIYKHYNIPSTLNGTGQTIAIVDAPGSVYGTAIQTDLNTFSAYYGLPQCNTNNPCFKQIDLSNGAKVVAGSSNDWAVEVALDTQWAHAIAPKATILLVTAKSSSLTDIMAAINTASTQAGVVVISMSFGATEFSTQTSATYDGALKTIMNKGIVLFASSGDSGNNGSNQEWPAASPSVTGVGGSSIRGTAATLPTSTSELVWVDGGGGASSVESMPAFQNPVVGASFLKLDSTHRSIPDIAYDADPTYSPVGVVAKGIWYGVGGTSVGAPQWSGIAALIAQYRVNNARSTTLTGLVASNSAGFNGIIYGSGWHTSSSLFDVTSGNDNTGRTKTCSICTAATGYDAATGWGVPNVGNLVANF